jgi:hypothetical protein
VDASVVAVPGALPVVGADRQYFSMRSSVVLSRMTQIRPPWHERSPVHERAHMDMGVPLTVRPLQMNDGSPQSASTVHLVVHAPRDDAQTPVAHCALSARVPVHAAPMPAPPEIGARQCILTGFVKTKPPHTHPATQQSESRAHSTDAAASGCSLHPPSAPPVPEALPPLPPVPLAPPVLAAPPVLDAPPVLAAPPVLDAPPPPDIVPPALASIPAPPFADRPLAPPPPEPLVAPPLPAALRPAAPPARPASLGAPPSARGAPPKTPSPPLHAASSAVAKKTRGRLMTESLDLSMASFCSERTRRRPRRRVGIHRNIGWTMKGPGDVSEATGGGLEARLSWGSFVPDGWVTTASRIKTVAGARIAVWRAKKTVVAASENFRSRSIRILQRSPTCKSNRSFFERARMAMSDPRLRR